MFKYTIKDMQAIAKAKGGKCLSDKYIGIRKKLIWQCKVGHEWSTKPNQIISHNSWCPICSRIREANSQRGTIEMMKALAIKKGGKCLSNIYIDVRSHLHWQCNEGHSWHATPNAIASGTWCKTCGAKRAANKMRGSLKPYQDIAEKRGGNCLSTEYINNYTKLKWQCAKGHEWMAEPNRIKVGTWCPVCANNIKHTIDDMQQIASKHGGKCLSTEYIPKKLLLWECSKGHTWRRGLQNINKGSWCPTCRKEQTKLNKLKPPIQ